MSSAKGGGAAKGGSGAGKGGGEVVPMPGGPIDGGQVIDLPTPPPEPPYNPQLDFYGEGNMVNQPLPGYFQTYPAPGGNNYAPPVVEEVVGNQPADPDDPLAGMTPEMLAWLTSNVYNGGGQMSPYGGGGGQTYNPDFLPNTGGVYGGTILNPSIYR
jgi:hypothetical protein